MIRILLGLALLIGLMFLFSWLGKASPADRARALKLVLLYGGVGALLLLVVTGRLPWLFALAGAAVPWIQRGIMAKRAFNYFKAAAGPTSGQASRVATEHIRMILDHDTGEMNGEILTGHLAGKMLDDLDLPTLIELIREFMSSDQKSAQLLAAYMDRRFEDQWREAAGAAGQDDPETVAGGIMSRSEALEVLGLEPHANREDIIKAHRSLIQKMHPDRGGSSYLAAKINQAKDILLDDDQV